jgi:hypothetical protein
MADAHYRLMPILRIAQRITGADAVPLADALRRAGYAAARPHLGAGEIRAALLAHPSLVEEWLAYSQDKQTTQGWYVLRDGEIGQLLRPASQRSFTSIEEAVAEFIIRELDHQAALADGA